MVLLLPVAGFLLLAGVTLLVLGWRGRLVHNRPTCARCTFDLSGIAADGVCPECGAGLAGPRAVRAGLRRRRRGVVGAGLFCLVLLAAGVGVFVWGATTRRNWNTVKPGWLLVWEAEHARAADALVIAELMARRGNGGLGVDEYRRLARHALQIQADASAPWSPFWGDLIEDACALGDLGREDLLAYMAGMGTHELRFRTRVHAGSGVPYVVESEVRRGGTRPRAMDLKFGAGELVLERSGAEPIRVPQGGGFSMNGWRGTTAVQGSRAMFNRVEVAPGRYRCTITLPGTLAGGGVSVPFTVTRTSEVEVVPDSEPVVTFGAEARPAPKVAAVLALGYPRTNSVYDMRTQEVGRVPTSTCR